MQRARSGVDADAMLRLTISRELLFETFDFASESELTALKNALNGGIDFGFNASVLRF